MTRITDLPECIDYYLRDYLIEDDYQQLLNTSKKNFGQIRRKTIIYHLNENYSLNYCKYDKLRYQLLGKVENPLKQIIIKLNYSRIKHYKAVFDHCPVHVICTGFSGANPFISLQHVKEVSLYRFPSDITSLPHIDKCEKVNLESCSEISDVSVLKDCKHLTLDTCNKITDFSSLGRQETLSIQRNDHLIRVVNFGSIGTLVLVSCPNLTDVSPLHGVYDLTLKYCSGITDISSLGGHYRLDITSCSPMLFGFHALKDIPIVKLIDSTISDVSVLSNAKVIHLECCDSLVDVRPLRGVKELTLKSCLLIEDISMLTTVQKLSLHKLPHLNNFEGINQMMNLTLRVHDLSDGMLEKFPNVKSLICSHLLLDNILPFLPSFTNLHSLTVAYASKVMIEVSLDIHTINLNYCAVKSISGLGKNRVVRLFRCHGDVLDVSSLATVPLVSIIQCQFNIMNYESLINVPRLKTDNTLLFTQLNSFIRR